MVQKNGGGDDTFVGPTPIAVARPMEASTTVPGVYPWAMRWQANSQAEIDWVFLADNATAAATRRLVAYFYNRRTATWDWRGTVTVTFPVNTAVTIRGFRMHYNPYSTGNVSVSGTAVTGNGTSWNTGACVGNRIGFGSTDPAAISTWYEISARANDTSITLLTSAGTYGLSTPYVIEDLRAIMSTTNATTANGGLFVCKGLNIDRFSSVAGTVPAATTVDNIRACYWLADAATVLNITSTGLALETMTTLSNHNCYVVDGTANPVIYKYNVRASLTLTAGKATNANVLKTNSGGAVTGAIGQLNNSRLARTNHGPHANIDTIYFTTATRIYAVQTADITANSTTFLAAGAATEVPPGGTATYAATGALSSLEYAGSIDKFIIATGATQKNYVSQFRTDGGQWDRVFGGDGKQIDQGTADSSITPWPSLSGAAYSVWAEDGMVYLATLGTTAILNRVYAVPMGADWEYADTTNAFIITPAISCPDADNLQRVAVNALQVVGGKTTYNLGMTPEGYRIKYRTSGITDNSGAWTLVPDTGNISGSASSVQFKFEFRTIGLHMIPARIQNLAVIYEDTGTDSHFQFSTTKSDATTKRFAWRFSTAFGSTVPALKVRLYNAVSGALLLTDTTSANTLGTFQKTTDGTSWGAYNSTDKGNETTYIRYTPDSLGDNINVRPVLTLA